MSQSFPNSTKIIINTFILLILFSFPSIAIAQNSSDVSKIKSGYIRIGKKNQEEVKPEVTDNKADATKIVKEAPAEEKDSSTIMPWRHDDGLRTAEIQLMSGKYTQAIKTLDKVLKRHPANADAYVYIGFSYMELGLMDKAKKNLKRGLKISSNHMGAHLYLGIIALKENKTNIAMERLNALKALCRGMICAEEDFLSNEINAHKKKKKSKKDE